MLTCQQFKSQLTTPFTSQYINHCIAIVIATLAILITICWPFSSALAHQAGVIDTHIKANHSSVDLIYTVPGTKLNQRFDLGGSKVENIQDKLTALLNPIGNSFNIHNNQAPCRIVKTNTNTLAHINSAQFIFNYRCDAQLDLLTIIDLNHKKLANYQNFTRFNLAGQNKSIVFDATHTKEQIPVGQLLSLWKKKLPTEQLLTKNSLWQSSHYLTIGFEHILAGWDHILFLLGMILLISRTKQLILLVSCFTLAHSLSLALAITNVLTIPVKIVEVLIAASIVYVAIDNYKQLNKNSSNSSYGTHPAMVIAFGFIHGFGFSFLLQSLGHENGLFSALMFFNIGVELGQLVIVLPLFLILKNLKHIINAFNFMFIHPSLQTSLEYKVQQQSAMTIKYQQHQIAILITKQLICLSTGLMGVWWLVERL